MTVPAWFETFTDEVESGEPQALACEACGSATLPPRQVCPECGSPELTQTSLSDRGRIVSFTEISVTIPKFHGETPYTVVLAELNKGVVLTGQLREVTADDVAIGDEVQLGVEARDDGTSLLTFRPVNE
ncbi:hypothetical protein SAMN04487948_11454 [Halogranum amylolyticum]|uniref:DUF35 domain-containing protein n=1 Tax=Halogranum amylolyticum TaxID=660520 RepID=A0A1H8V756_9EURY|nr:hypothetical protein SAMN04487948_11454 [Halogranum amylolyticum]